ncbi:C40 family peptidase [Chlamydia pneumoniae]|uniref:Polysaccharide hydrolase-invasin repeat family n=1 Tax=Chlamydia pneumoniae TaxID=83558 RepID=A0A0F7WM07_CHLPN|nr:NlpC/P60 family protein [Chlamydia pneumoniae]BAA98455.1 polysaccharide hydrolase-invasin repeat family [Chlamydia pneumoniae J138]CRI41255.1 Polysaccharide hydrolase-invasin repeat family [Chlamydia pneumoniae]
MKHYLSFSPSADFFSKQGAIETQVLFGERVLVKGSTCYAYSQLFHNELLWKPYPGHSFRSTLVPCTPEFHIHPNVSVVSVDAFLDPWGIPLPFGTLLHVNSQNTVIFPKDILNHMNTIWGSGTPQCDPRHLRRLNYNFLAELLIKDADLLLNFPYVWGGRSVHESLEKPGVDCSGFINILYQAQGYNVPRNAADQYADCHWISSFENLPSGGLIFLYPKEEKRISHVMLKQDSSTLIHASGGGKKVEYFILEQDGKFLDSTYLFFRNNQRGRAFFGIPRKRKAFL